MMVGVNSGFNKYTLYLDLGIFSARPGGRVRGKIPL
jgi:hypothetical protein